MSVITDINELDFSKKYTYADYVKWQFDEVVELIHGKIYRMSPAPNLNHQRLSARLFTYINSYLIEGEGECEAFTAPFDVRLPLPPKKVKKNKIDTVVQPDITIVCDPSKLDMAGCKGAPDWVIEILSKGTGKKDLNEKFELYQHAGVTEYWIAHPSDGTLLIFRLNKKGKYQSIKVQPFTIGDIVSPAAFPDMKIDLTKVFS